MIRIGKLTDYALVLLGQFAKVPFPTLITAKKLCASTEIPLPTVSKLLKKLTQGGFLISHRGTAGGYELARDAESISVAEVVAFMEGPIGLTECTSMHEADCLLVGHCSMQGSWATISRRIESTLSQMSVGELAGVLASPRLPAERAPGAPL